MSKVKTAVAGVLVGAGALASGQAMADVSGSLNVTSEYMFRGIESSGGAAVQGSIDWSAPSGIYAGVWASNTSPVFDGNEFDIYAGWAGEVGNGVGVDLGLVYYAFPEQDENFPGADDVDYLEGYIGLSLGGLSGSVYYASDYFGTDEEGTYFTLAYSHGITETVEMTFQVGFNDGEGVEAFIGEEYTDWSITTSKDLGDGWGASFGYVQTDLDDDDA
ncbi:MAG: TorF family putative porin [Salinisphaeraceae bacterium]|nr:TorF family putative porin [Salinisphaeraceae bacterium]